MRKWIAASAAIAVLFIAGCGAKMPTVAENPQDDPPESKFDINTEYTGNDIVIEAVE